MQAVNLHEDEIVQFTWKWKRGLLHVLYYKSYVLPDTKIMNLQFPQASFIF